MEHPIPDALKESLKDFEKIKILAQQYLNSEEAQRRYEDIKKNAEAYKPKPWNREQLFDFYFRPICQEI